MGWNKESFISTCLNYLNHVTDRFPKAKGIDDIQNKRFLIEISYPGFEDIERFNLNEFICKLSNQSFEGWNEDEIRGYMTALTTIREKAKQ